MGELIVFLVLILIPLGAYLVNAGIANRGMRTIRDRAREAGVSPPAARPKPAKVVPLRPDVARENCGRDLVHALLFVTGAGGSCRYCLARAEQPAAPVPADPGPATPPVAVDVLAEVQRLLEDRKP